MIILGIDPGSLIAGVAVVEVEGATLRGLHLGEIRVPAKVPLEQRLYRIFVEIGKLVERFHPAVMVLEDTFFARNMHTAFVIGQARAAAMMAAAQHDIPIQLYAPAEVKKAVAGFGSADKTQVSYMIRAMLDWRQPLTSPDATDAAAVALTHAHRFRIPTK